MLEDPATHYDRDWQESWVGVGDTVTIDVPAKRSLLDRVLRRPQRLVRQRYEIRAMATAGGSVDITYDGGSLIAVCRPAPEGSVFRDVRVTQQDVDKK